MTRLQFHLLFWSVLWRNHRPASAKSFCFKMKRLTLLLLFGFLPFLVFAEKPDLFWYGKDFDITKDNKNFQIWPSNKDLKGKKDGGPYFIMIELASSEDRNFKNPIVSITQGIPIDIDTPYPLSIQPDLTKAAFLRVTIFSDACFSGWKRKKGFSISEKGISELAPKIQNKSVEIR